MTVLIAVASRHGGTRGIADAIADELRRVEIRVAVRDASGVIDLSRYEAVILGSVVYMGRWLPDARRFAEAHGETLRALPVWLFTSGPIGDPSKPSDDASDLSRVDLDLGAKDSQTFDGRLDPAELGLTERIVVKAIRAPAGDFREWAEIRAWAHEIGAALRPASTRSPLTTAPIPSEIGGVDAV